MHETLIKGVTIGVVSGLFVWWLTSHREAYGAKSKYTGSVGGGTCADCQCCGLPVPTSTATPLATDYLCNPPSHVPAISGWNLGVSINTNCGLDASVYADRMRSSREFSVGRNVRATGPTRVVNPLNCNPDFPGSVCCRETI